MDTNQEKVRVGRSAAVRAGLARLVSALVCALIVIAAPVGVGIASADPTPAVPGGGQGAASSINGSSLPEGFPTDLKQYVGGTEEFKKGPWFSGSCADKGGDIGAYINATLPVEGKLLYWAQSDEDRKKNGADSKELPSFPAGDSAFFMPTGMCVNDMKRWGSTTLSVWGFDFAKTPDRTSLVSMAKRLGISPDGPGFWDIVTTGPAAKLIDDTANPKFSRSNFNADKAQGPFKAHAFFLDCDANANATSTDQVARCRGWNDAVGKLFAGTWNWIVKNMSLGDRISQSWDKNTAPYVQAWNTLWKIGSGIVKFVADPKSYADSWANDMKDWAMSMTPKVLKGLASVGRFDYTAPGFIAWYGISITLGWLTMMIMLLITIVQGNQEKMPLSEVMKSMFAYAPGTLITMAAVPLLISTLILPVANGLTDFLSEKTGTTTQEAISNITTMFSALNNQTLVGGTISGLIGYGAMGLGAFSMYLGFMMHMLAVPLGTIAVGISLGMYVNPQMRAKSLRPVLTLLAIIFSTPLLFLLLGVLMWMMSLTAKGNVTGDGDVKSLGALLFVAMCFVVMGLAPFSLLKWAPVLPSGDDAPGFSSQGGSVIGAAAGGAAGSFAARSAMTRGFSGGGGRGGAGSAGRSAPAAAPAQASSGTAGTPGGPGGAPAANPANASRGAGRSGRVGGHGQQFLSAARTAVGSVGGPLSAAAMVTGAGASAAVRKARTDFESTSAKGIDR